MSVSASGLSFHQTKDDREAPAFGHVTIRVLLRADSFECYRCEVEETFSFNTSQMSKALKPLRKKRDFLSITIEDDKMTVETLEDRATPKTSTAVVNLNLVPPTSCLKIEETFDVLPHVVRSSLFHKVCKIESDLSDLLTLRKIGEGRISITSQIEGVATLRAELGCGQSPDDELVALSKTNLWPSQSDQPSVTLPAPQLIGLSETAGALTDKLYIHFGEFGSVMLRSHVGTLGEMFSRMSPASYNT